MGRHIAVVRSAWRHHALTRRVMAPDAVVIDPRSTPTCGTQPFVMRPIWGDGRYLQAMVAAGTFTREGSGSSSIVRVS